MRHKEDPNYLLLDCQFANYLWSFQIHLFSVGWSQKYSWPLLLEEVAFESSPLGRGGDEQGGVACKLLCCFVEYLAS